jgi:hypothetical protein
VCKPNRIIVGINLELFVWKTVRSPIRIGKNQVHKVNGLQIGLFNRCVELNGLQIGLWNVNEKRKLPIVNW